MRTTLDLPEDLINEAMKITKAKSKTELIKNALKNIIVKNKLQALKKYKGSVKLEIDIDELRGRNESFSG